MPTLSPAHRELLAKLRNGSGMTQAELAKKLGVSRPMVGMVEIGTKDPSDDLLDAWCDLFGMEVATTLAIRRKRTMRVGGGRGSWLFGESFARLPSVVFQQLQILLFKFARHAK